MTAKIRVAAKNIMNSFKNCMNYSLKSEFIKRIEDDGRSKATIISTFGISQKIMPEYAVLDNTNYVSEIFTWHPHSIR